MNISTIQIKNFKKLQDVTIPIQKDQSIFVGANNSGKTTAFEAISKFLKPEHKEGKRFDVYDFTIYNWSRIDELFNELQELQSQISKEKDVKLLLQEFNEKQKELEELFPSLKVVIDIEENELHRVIDLIPKLDNNIKQVAVYQRYEPKDYIEIFEDYKKACDEAKRMKEILDESYQDRERIDNIKAEVPPKNIKDFLEKDNKLNRYFTIRYYLANPSVEDDEFPHEAINEFDINPLKSLIEVDEINAQRGLTDNESDSEFKVTKRISSQFARYHKRFNEENQDLDEHDGAIMYAKKYAEHTIGERLRDSLTSLITPLETLGYPAFGSPNIDVEPVIDIIKTIENEGNILFNPDNNKSKDLLLPESSNGLGFQNLIYIYLKLQYFCRSRLLMDNEEEIKPLHIILIEEPEAHLHAQAQKVFIDKAMDIITKDQPASLNSQLLLSTHSSYIANESKFNNLLYFKRELNKDNHLAKVVHLSDVPMDPRVNYMRKYKDDEVGEKELRNYKANERFVKKYLEVAEHDLFFADAIILIEGSAERILLPQMMKNESSYLSSKFITFFEVGGAYSHLFFPWLEALERPTLIITDIDTVQGSGNKTKTHTTIGDNKISKNPTIWKWFNDNEITIDNLVRYKNKDKEKDNMRITYQYKDYGEDAYSRTFEDDFALTNKELFKEMSKVKGLAQKFKDIFIKYDNINEDVTEKLFEYVDNTKTTFALDILFNELALDQPFKTPTYIKEGFTWLEQQLKKENDKSGDQ